MQIIKNQSNGYKNMENKLYINGLSCSLNAGKI